MFQDLKYQLNIAKKLLVDKYPRLRRVLSINYGLLPEIPSDKDYIMGASDDKINWAVLKPDSNWLPEAEKMFDEEQRGRLVETMGCTGFALNNVEEMIELNKWGKAINRSDRFLNKISGTTKSGNSMNYVLEARRKYGFVEEKDWSWDKNNFDWDDYYRPLSPDIKEKALINAKKYTFGYDSVWSTSKQMLNEALKYSPLYVGLYAWYRRGMLYYSVGSPNHASVIINRNTFMDYDSYDPFIKHLNEDFSVFYVKRIYLEKADVDFNMTKIKELMAEGYKYGVRPDNNGEFYKITENGLEYIKDLRVIADDIAKYMKETPTNINDMLKFLTQEKKIKWLSEKEYLSYLN